MTKKSVYILVNIFFFAIIFDGCKTSSDYLKTNSQPVPLTFLNAKDSSNSAEIKWKPFFNDTNLFSIIDTALNNNLDLLITIQKIEVARNELRLNKGALFPFVSGGGAIAQRKYGLYTMDGAGNISTQITPGQTVPIHLPDYFLGLQTTWEADIWGKLRNKKRAAFARYLSSIEGKNLVLTNLISELAITYYELLSLDNELDIIRETIKLQQDALAIIKIQKQAGKTSELAVKQFEAQVLNSQGLEFEVLQKITENENKLNFLSGRFPQKVVREKVNYEGKLPLKVRSGIPSDMLKNRPDIRRSEFELAAAQCDLKAAKSAFYPSFIITGALGFQAFNTGLLFTAPESFTYSLMGNLTAPLINRSAIKAQFKTAQAKQLDAMYNYQKSILNGFVEVTNELSNIKNLERIYDLKNQEVIALTQSIAISNDLFRSGRANYFEVLMTQRSALQSRLELVNTKKRQHISVVNIYKALGGGWK